MTIYTAEINGRGIAAFRRPGGRRRLGAWHRLSGGPVPPRNGRSGALGWRGRNLRPARAPRRGSEMAGILGPRFTAWRCRRGLAAIGSRGGDSGEGKKSSLRASQAPRPTSRHSGRRHEPLLANYGGYRRTRLHPERDRYREQEEGLDRRGRRLRTASCFGSSHASRKTLHFTHIPAPPCPHGAIMRTKEERRQSWPASG